MESIIYVSFKSHFYYLELWGAIMVRQSGRSIKGREEIMRLREKLEFTHAYIEGHLHQTISDEASALKKMRQVARSSDKTNAG